MGVFYHRHLKLQTLIRIIFDGFFKSLPGMDLRRVEFRLGCGTGIAACLATGFLRVNDMISLRHLSSCRRSLRYLFTELVPCPFGVRAPFPLGLSLPSLTMFQYGGLVLSPCLSFPESPVGESRVTSSKSPVASIQSLRSETRSRSVGRSSHHWNRVPGLAVLTMPTASWIGFPPAPRRETARPPGTAPGRYRSSPSRLTSSRPTLWEAGRRYRGYPPRIPLPESNRLNHCGHEKTGVRRLEQAATQSRSEGLVVVDV